MTKLTKKNLEELIGQRIEIFKNADEAVSKYNAEQETIKEYNGRQILELTQNADDARANTISIKLNTEKNELIFYNDGVAFNYEGIKSIMIANLSSKITSTYIGNKGLGFRSILNWAQSVTIYSAGLEIEFSHKVLENYLDNELQSLKSNLEEIRTSRNLSSTCIPIPILGLPRVSENLYEGCTEDKGCALKIIYDESKQEDIINQIKAIDERTLLFLPNINTVKVEIGTEVSTISDNEDKWYILSKDDELLDQYQDKNKNEKKKYIVKVAIPKSGLMEGTNSLYNYLPTKEQVHLPFLLHATVELNSSRNHVNESDVNVFILEKAAALIKQLAQDKLNETTGSSNWTAFRMMTPTVQEKDYGSLKPLYVKLTELKKTMSIYPTVDKQYVTADKYYYYEDDISRFWMDFDAHRTSFSKMLQPKEGQYEIETHPLADFSEALTVISTSIAGDIPKRVSLIRHLFDYKCLYNPPQTPLLIDVNNSIICDRAYIQDNGDDALTNNLPSWVDFKIIHIELAKQLIKEFKAEIESAKQQKQDSLQSFSEVRCLVGLLDFVDIHYFDKTGIANQVISQANDRLDNDTTHQKDKLIGEMLDFLYTLGSVAELKYVRLLNEGGEVKKAEDLMLPTELNKEIFDGVDVQYVRELNEWGKLGYLSGVTDNSYEEFMRKLGVNRLMDSKKFRNVANNDEYKSYLRNHKVCDDSSDVLHRWSDLWNGSCDDVEVDIVRDTIIDKLIQINLHKVFRFISSNSEIFENLKKTIQLWFFYNRNRRDIWTPYNYIRYQLSSLHCVKWKVLGSDLIIDNTIDIDAMRQTTPNVVEIAELIRTDFCFERASDISKFLNEYSSSFSNGDNIRKLYKLVVDGLADRDEGLNNVRLYASDVDGKKDYHPSTEVFYSDNTCLPKRVIEESNLFRLDYPSRQGVDKITRIFGLQKLNNLSFKITGKTFSGIKDDFNLFFIKLKPYILIYAIQNVVKQDAKKAIATYIKSCNINLVSHCKYSIKDGASKELEDGEFINVDNDYYLKVSDLSNLETMKASTVYCNAIMEILGMAFKLETKNEHFLHVFQNFDFMKRYIDETRKDDIEECYKLLGISTEEKRFWGKYGELKGLTLNDEATNFYSTNQPKLGFSEQEVKNVDFSEWKNKESIDFLNKALKTLDIDDQKKELLGIVDLSAWHRSRFEHVKAKYRTAFVHRLWTILNGKCSHKRNLLLKLQVEYGNIHLEEDWPHEEKTDADILSYLNQQIQKMFKQNDLDSKDVHLENDENVEGPKNLYPQLVKNEQDEKDMGDNRWMLYFEGNKDEISKYIAQQHKEEQNESEEDAQDDADVEGEIVTLGVVAPPHSDNTGKGNGRNGGVHTTKSERSKARSGAFAEKQVDKYLRKMASQDKRYEYRDEDWVSKKDDTLGYDFTYIVDDQTRYLEAKYLADHTFILTANEYKVAMDNIEIYDIATVDKTGKVTIHQAFFKGSPKFDVKDYSVSFVTSKEL